MKKNRSNMQILSKIKEYMPADEEVITCMTGYLGCERVECMVVIKGVPFDNNSAFYKELTLMVMNKNCCVEMELKGGYNPRCSLMNFNDDGGDEIYITIDSGGSGGYQYFYVCALYKCKLKMMISDDMYNQKYDNYKCKYLDYFKAEIKNEADYVWLCALCCKGSEYLSQIYDMDGKLKMPRDGTVSSANYSCPIYDQKRNTHELLVYQRVTGMYQADSLGYMECRLKFKDYKYMGMDPYFKSYGYVGNTCLYRQN